MRILFMGDSITDMGRDRNDGTVASFGFGYPFFVHGELCASEPQKHTFFNRGISGNRVVDIYARIKADCWNLKPDVISVLIGVNDVWHDLDASPNGVDIVRYERVYRTYVEETRERVPGVQFMLMEPFVLKGPATADNYEHFMQVKEYAKVVKRLAEEYGLVFIPLQERLDELAAKTGAEYWLYDGVHPSIAGSKVISEEWLKGFAKLNK